MGSTWASGMADAVNEGLVDLRTALHSHLRVNHYPPHPECMVAIAHSAVLLANAGQWGDRLELPEGVTYKNGANWVTVAQAIESLHLDSYIEGEED